MSRTPYRQPKHNQRVEIVVVNSRFIASAGVARSVEEARAFIAAVRAEMTDASHHVYAFQVGYGNSITEGLSDDGEPSGTAGPPVRAVLRGADIGDCVVVVTRYFGGTLLGTGGLVRAYGDAAKAVLTELPLEWNIPKRTLGIEMSYSHYQGLKRLVLAHEGEIQDESFAADVTIIAAFPEPRIEPFRAALREATAGSVEALEMD